MNRHARQIARKMLRKALKTPAAIPVRPGQPPIVEAAYVIVREFNGGPATEVETALSQDIAARLLPQLGGIWFHGGIPGRHPGDWLLPSGVTLLISAEN